MKYMNRKNPLLLFQADGSGGMVKTDDTLSEIEGKEKENSSAITEAEKQLENEHVKIDEENRAKEQADAEAERIRTEEALRADAEIRAEFEAQLIKPDADLEEMEKAIQIDESELEQSNLDGGQVKPDKVDNEDKTNDQLITIDDEYIASQPEDVREILNGIKGDQMTPRVYKNYMSAQKHIISGSAPTKETEVVDDFENQSLEEMLNSEQEKQEIPKEVEHEQMITKLSADQITGKRDELALRKIQSKYPDFPDDGLSNTESLNDYYRDMADERPSEFDEFKSDVSNAKSDATVIIKNKVQLARNWKELAQQSVSKAVGDFTNFLTSKGLTPEDVGFDLKDSATMKSFLYDSSGKANPDVVFHNEGVPMIMPDVLAQKLKDRFLDKVIDAKENNARTSGFQKRKAYEPAPSISSTDLRGQSTLKVDVPNVIDHNMSMEEMDKIMAKQLKEAEESI